MQPVAENCDRTVEVAKNQDLVEVTDIGDTF